MLLRRERVTWRFALPIATPCERQTVRRTIRCCVRADASTDIGHNCGPCKHRTIVTGHNRIYRTYIYFNNTVQSSKARQPYFLKSYMQHLTYLTAVKSRWKHQALFDLIKPFIFKGGTAKHARTLMVPFWDGIWVTMNRFCNWFGVWTP